MTFRVRYVALKQFSPSSTHQFSTSWHERDRYRERTYYVNTHYRHYARRFVKLYVCVLLPRFSLAISTGAAFLNGRGSDQSKRAISIPVFLNTRKSNFAMCDYTRARAHSTPLRSFAIMHAFTSIITRKWLALFTQYLQERCK